MSLNGRDIFNETEYFKEQAYWIIYGTTPAPTPNVTTGTAAAYQLNPSTTIGIRQRRLYRESEIIIKTS